MKKLRKYKMGNLNSFKRQKKKKRLPGILPKKYKLLSIACSQESTNHY